MISVVKMNHSCSACPSQWEAITDDGRFVYIRYRWGCLSVGVGETFREAVGSDLWEVQCGDGYHGTMETEVMMSRTDSVINWDGLKSIDKEYQWKLLGDEGD